MNTIQNGGNLYRRLNADTFIRYDPVADEFTFVPAMAVPELFDTMPTAATTGTHGLLLSAMLQHQIQASKHGTPADAVPTLQLVAESLRDPASLVRLHRIWDAQQQGFVAPEREHEPLRSNPPVNAANVNRARRVLDAIIASGLITREHLRELAMHLPVVPLVELRRARALVDSRVNHVWGDAQMRQALCDTLLNQLHTTGSPV